MSDGQDPRAEAHDVQHRRVEAAHDRKEKRKIEKKDVRPLLGEPGGKSEEWD